MFLFPLCCRHVLSTHSHLHLPPQGSESGVMSHHPISFKQQPEHNHTSSQPPGFLSAPPGLTNLLLSSNNSVAATDMGVPTAIMSTSDLTNVASQPPFPAPAGAPSQMVDHSGGNTILPAYIVGAPDRSMVVSSAASSSGVAPVMPPNNPPLDPFSMAVAMSMCMPPGKMPATPYAQC